MPSVFLFFVPATLCPFSDCVSQVHSPCRATFVLFPVVSVCLVPPLLISQQCEDGDLGCFVQGCIIQASDSAWHMGMFSAHQINKQEVAETQQQGWGRGDTVTFISVIGGDSEAEKLPPQLRL